MEIQISASTEMVLGWELADWYEVGVTPNRVFSYFWTLISTPARLKS